MLAFSAFSGGRVEVRARAKVNLALEVLGRRADGYHELRSVMWAIELADRVTLEASGGDIALECVAADVPRTPDNLAWRAAELVRRETGTVTGLRIRIEKRIPVAAGLGHKIYFVTALLAGIFFISAALKIHRHQLAGAKKFVTLSIYYLLILIIAMVVDKIL